MNALYSCPTIKYEVWGLQQWWCTFVANAAVVVVNKNPKSSWIELDLKDADSELVLRN